MIAEALGTIVINTRKNARINENDYQKENLWHCGTCHTPKECLKSLGGQDRILPCICKCQQEQKKQEETRWEQQQKNFKIRRLTHDGVVDKRYLEYTFANDDGQTPKVTQICQNFVANFREIQRDKTGGLLFCGDVGTGKTFFACCIANALLAQGVPVAITNLAMVISQLQDLDTKQQVIPKLCRKKLVVLDDLGAERNTSFAKEQVFNVIDSLIRAEVVVIVTSNLSPQEMTATTDLTDRRIYDRVLNDLCPLHIPVTGRSRREEQGKDKSAELKKRLGM